MLKVIDGGVQITLTGKDKNPLFIISMLLIILALIVAVIAMTMSIRITIGALFVFACLIFAFNIYKNKMSNQSFISTGQLIIKNRHFISGGHAVKLSNDAKIEIINQTLIINDLGRVWHIVGFEQDKEIHVAKSVLEGKPLEKKERAIRLL